MEKIVQSLGEHLKPVKIYIDDVESIIDIYHQVSSLVNITTEDFSLKDIQELSNLKKEQLSHLSLSIPEPYVSLRLKPNEIWLYIDKDEPISRGLYEQVKMVLAKRERKFARIIHSPITSGVFLGISLPNLIYGIKETNKFEIIIFSVLTIISIALFFYSRFDQFERYSQIILKHKIDKPSFWKRNSDKIILSCFSAIAGGIITLILFKVFGIVP